MSIRKKIFLPLLTSLTFAGSFVAGKYAIYDLQPLTITLIRYLIALFFLASLLFHYGASSLKVASHDLLRLFLLGLFGVVGYHFFFFSSLGLTAVANTAVINAMSPVITGLLASIFIRERLSSVNYAGVTIALVGVIILLTDGKLKNIVGLNFNRGDMLMLCAVVSWAIYALLIKVLMKKYSGFTVTFYVALFGVIILAIICPIFEGPDFNIRGMTTATILSIFYMGIVASGIGYFLYNLSVHKIGPTRTSSVVYSLVPVFVAILALLFFKESVSAIILLSIILIIIGLNLLMKKRQQVCSV